MPLSKKHVALLILVVLLPTAAFLWSIWAFGCWWINISPSELAAWVTGLGTLVLALVAAIQSRQNGKQLKISDRNVAAAEAQTSIAQESAKAAQNTLQEAIRSRADQFAPRVIAFYEQPQTPLADPFRSSMPGATDLRLLDPKSLARASEAPGQEFIFPESESTFLWFHGRALLINEGNSTARVRLPTESIFVEGRSWLDGRDVAIPALIQEGVTSSAILPPGGIAMFQWAAGHAVKEWASACNDTNRRSPFRDIWLWVTVFDSREVGVVDTMLAHFIPDPVTPVQHRLGHWKVRDVADFGMMHPLPTKRNYVFEGKMTEDLTQRDAYYRGETV